MILTTTKQDVLHHRSSTRSDIELLKILSAFGIVWFHSEYSPARDVAYAGLIVFLIFSAYFATSATREHSVKDRSVRLLMPCIFWSLLYAASSIARDQSVFSSGDSLISNILTTPSIHLWYLPFTFISIVTIDRIRNNVDPLTLAVSTTIFASILLITSPAWRQWSYASPLSQYMHAIPAILIGILMGLGKKIELMPKIFLLGLVTISVLFTYIMKIPGVGVTYLIGIIAASILLRGKSLLPRNNLMQTASNLTFGIYLIHPILLFVLKHIGVHSVALPIASFAASAVCIYTSLKLMPKSISRYLM